MKISTRYIFIVSISTVIVAIARHDSIEPVWLRLMVIVLAALGLLIEEKAFTKDRRKR